MPTPTSRRDFIKTTGTTAVAASAVLSTAPQLFAAQDSTIKVALVGCGGRGSGAATQALSVEGQGPIQLVAMADVFEKNLENKHKQISRDIPGPEKVAVPPEIATVFPVLRSAPLTPTERYTLLATCGPNATQW